MMSGGGRGSQSNLDKLLENASNDGGNGATLEAVLSDSEVLNECKWGAKRLMEL